MSDPAYDAMRKQAHEIIERAFIATTSTVRNKRLPTEREKQLLHVGADSILNAAKQYFYEQLRTQTVGKR